MDKTLEIKKTVNINLNNHTISAPEKVFLVEGGSLNLSGKGTIRENKPYYGAIVLKGSSDPTDKDYTTVSVGKDVVLEGWSGIFIDHNDENPSTSHGVLVNMNGTIKSVDDVEGGAGAGIYVNGNIKNQTNSPIVNLSETTKITSTGNGIYSAGYATYNINGAYIEGVESGIGMKAGVFNIYDGVVLGTGEDKTPTSGNNNGINPSGVAIQMESNSGYAGDMELYIKDGNITSKNINVIYEYTVGSSLTKVSNISLSGGTYKSEAGKDVFSLSSDFTTKIGKFISGGTYSSDPTTYLKSGYEATKNSNNQYVVTSTTMSVFGSSNGENSNNTLLIIFIVILFIVLGIITYLKRQNIFDFIRNLRNR